MAKLQRRLRLGMVGGGPGAFIGAVHRMAARLDDRFELVAAALSSDPEKSKSFAKEIHVPRAYGSYQEMAEAEAKHPEPIDVVAIVTPNSTHYPVAKAFLNAGIPVMCDKPMTMTVDEAEDLAAIVHKSGLTFGLTHTYSGYPMVRQMREMILDGALGKIRMINVAYVQGWLSTPVEQTGAKQAEWRTDPTKSGKGGALGDIATHAYHIALFTTGLKAESIAADVTTFVPGRRLDDNVQAMIRFEGGAKASLIASQIAAGIENDLTLRIHGELGSFEWHQENPNYLIHSPLNDAPRTITRGGPTAGPWAVYSTRVPSGHPEGYLEAFGQLYKDLAELLAAKLEDREPNPISKLLPDVQDGVRGMRFIDAVLASSENGSAWTKL
ncbi:Gfo/Idh/MocA family protein [Terriglobus sp. TAA 43]|uniref:Gfo/Idh/MocA family protein n=1 Tax=Terriglobus sp. TAA 43 TaxID=278961 RepID=UPI0006471E56|nr:Gfo/Idh/MocA family oxidoreductase [Terriglobus sp. TAA 43]